MFNSFKEYRCRYCNKLFFKGDLKYCTIEIKCRKCKNVNEIKGLNCKLLLLPDEQAFYKRDNKPIAHCTVCVESNDCKYYKTIVNKTI